MALDTFQEQRRAAAHRRRRILLNNEGGDLNCPEAATPEGFLSQRTTPLAGSQVDTILYCSHYGFGTCNHNTTVGEVNRPVPPRIPVHHGRTLIAQGRDCLQIITDFCHENGMEAFWSMRMNDVHDGSLPEFRSQFKKDHPEWLLGTEGDHRDDFVGEPRWWAGVDYEHAGVREMAFRLIEEVCRNYDLEGVELDFFRHPIYFKPNRRGLPAEPRHLEAMTDFIRRVHAMTVEVGENRGRPILVAVRIPDAVRLCVHMGIDIETWLKEGLIDMVIPGGYYHVVPWEEMIQLGHAHDVPVYPCISASRLRERVSQELDREYLLWRGEALNIWGAGADGVYAFNYYDFDKGDASFLKMGDSDKLKHVARIYAPNRGSINKWLGKELASSFGLLPLTVKQGQSQSAQLQVYEETSDQNNVETTLRLRFSDFSHEANLQVSLNGVSLSGLKISPLRGEKLSSMDVLAVPGCWVQCPVDPSVLKRGGNEITVTCTGGTVSEPLVFQDVQLEVAPLGEQK